MIRWLRTTLPPPWVLGVFALIYVTALAFSFLKNVHTAWAAFCLGAYALYRFLVYHPRYRPDYRHWLELMPWGGDKPLPFGPVHLVPQDAVVGATLIVLGAVRFLPFRIELPLFVAIYWLCGFLLVYLLAAAIYLHSVEMHRAGHAILYVLLLAVYVWWMPWLMLIVATAGYLIAFFGIRQSLRLFPWGMPLKYSDEYDFKAQQLAPTLTNNASTTDIMDLPGLRLLKVAATPNRRPEMEIVGPLLESLAPIDLKQRKVENEILFSILAAWAFFVASTIETHILPTYGAASIIAYGFIAVGVNGAHCGRYMTQQLPHLSLFGRLLWPRWLFMRYDEVWLVPILGLVLAAFAPIAFMLAGLRIPAALALSLFIYLLFIDFIGTPLERWKLEGKCMLRFKFVREPGRQVIQSNDAFALYIATAMAVGALCFLLLRDPFLMIMKYYAALELFPPRF